MGEIMDLHCNHWVQFNKELDKDRVRREFSKCLCGIAIYKGAELIGFCRLRETNLKCCPEITPWISSVFVKEKWRGRGYGKALMDEICARAKGLGYGTVYLWTDQTPGFYEKLGFVFLKTVQKNEGGDALLYKRDLEFLL